MDDAILELEPLVAAREGGLLRIKCAIALSRCYRESGDFERRSRSASASWPSSPAPRSTAADEAVQMAVTLAAAYNERGDSGQAVRTCRKAITKAEALVLAGRRERRRTGTPASSRHSRGSSAMPSRWPSALWRCWPKARAVATSPGSGTPARQHAAAARPARRRRGPGAISTRRPRRWSWCSASPVDIADNELARARAFFLAGTGCRRRRPVCQRIVDRRPRRTAAGGRCANSAGPDRPVAG